MTLAHISLLKYPGGKTRALNVLSQFLPPTAKVLYSPFFGGGSFELYCANHLGMRVVGSDNFTPLVNFWRCVLKNPRQVHRVLMDLLPVSKQKFEAIRDNFVSTKSQYKKAAMFFVLNRCSFNGKLRNYSDIPISKNIVERVKDFRADSVSIEQLNFIDSMVHVPRKDRDVVLFADPPYITEQYHYGWNGNMHKGFDHVLLRDKLAEMSENVFWILCYNDCPTVRGLYVGFEIHTVSWTSTMGYSTLKPEHNRKHPKEVIIISNALAKARGPT